MDKIGSILQTALGGMQNALRGLGRTANTVATSMSRDGDATALAEPLVRALEQQRALEASAHVLEHTARALDSILAALHR